MTWLGWLIAIVAFGFAAFVMWALEAILTEIRDHLDFHLNEELEIAKRLRPQPRKDAS